MDFNREETRLRIFTEKLEGSLYEHLRTHPLLKESRAIVNATGMGSKELVGDKNVVGAKGMVLKVYAPHIRECYAEESQDMCTHLIPRRDGIQIVGTVFRVGDIDTTLNEKALLDFEEIRERAAKFIPSLKGAKTIGMWQGIRPYRIGGIRFGAFIFLFLFILTSLIFNLPK